MSPELLLLVQRIMLHATGHAVALQPLDVGDAEAGSQQRILALTALAIAASSFCGSETLTPFTRKLCFVAARQMPVMSAFFTT